MTSDSDMAELPTPIVVNPTEESQLSETNSVQVENTPVMPLSPILPQAEVEAQAEAENLIEMVAGCANRDERRRSNVDSGIENSELEQAAVSLIKFSLDESLSNFYQLRPRKEGFTQSLIVILVHSHSNLPARNNSQKLTLTRLDSDLELRIEPVPIVKIF